MRSAWALLLLKELLAEGGAIWLHCDWHKSHYLRLLLDEVLGADAFRNEIVWQRTASRNDARSFGHIHDVLYYYTKAGAHTWNAPRVEHEESFLDRYSGKPWKGFDPARKGVHWKFGVEKLDQLDADGRIYWPSGGNGFPRLKRYLDEVEGRPISTIWDDVFAVNSQAEERSDYPTQKPEALLDRILNSTSTTGDLVLDCFVGSGTTAAVAQASGRRWIGCDINRGAIQTTAKRLQAIMREQADAAAEATDQPLPLAAHGDEGEAGSTPPPRAQLSFSVWRVNDYDLQIQHNEAVNLACEHIGVERTRSDSFFDGTLGKRLVKITPFDHPLSPVDLEEAKREIESRPDDDREITVVCLGIEHAARTWLDDWNRLRKGKSAANRIHVIELRTDEKYGSVIRHEPARARVKVERTKDQLTVTIEEFISPSIVERLRQQSGVLQPKIDDWRAMVDSVMIDTAYDGQVFNVTLSDIPERKSDLVAGTYNLAAPKGVTTVAVKIVDMLGEEVIVTQQC